MKKLKLFTLGLLGASFFLTSCADDEEDTLGPSVTITELNTGSTPNDDITIEKGQSISFAWDARKGDSDLERVSINSSGSNSPTNIPTSEAGNDFPYDVASGDRSSYLDTLVFSDAGLNEGTTSYTFTFRDADGNTAEAAFEVTVEDAGTPMNNEVNGAFFHIGGSLEGAYDLENETVVAASMPDGDKDMINMDLAGSAFTGSWTAGNSTMYVEASGFDYDGATVEAAETAYNNGTASASVNDPANGDIYIAKLRGNNIYAVIKIVDVDPDDNTCSCGNTGKITFDFKKA